MGGNSSAYQDLVYPVSHLTGERRAEWGPGFGQEGAAKGGGGGATQSVRGNYKSFKGTNRTVLEGKNTLCNLPGIVFQRTNVFLARIMRNEW